MARRAALMRLVSVNSETIRPPHTATGEAQLLIRTVPRRGIRFVAQLDEEAQPAILSVPLPASTRPSIAVLPFANLTPFG